MRQPTVLSGVDSANGRGSRVGGELVVGALVVSRFRRRQHEVLEV